MNTKTRATPSRPAPRMWVLTRRLAPLAALLGATSLGVTGCSEDSTTGAPTRDRAIDIVLGDVLDVDDIPNLEVFATPQPMEAGTVIELGHDDEVEVEGAESVTVLTEDSWVFFADLAPGWQFEHPAKIIVVAQADGSVQEFDVAWWPTIDGEQWWRTRASRDESGDKVFSQTTEPLETRAGRALVNGPSASAAATVPGYCRPEDIQKWALTVAASDDMAIDPSYAKNLALLLKTHGYQADVLGPTSLGQGQASVEAALANIRNKMLGTADEGYCDEFLLVWNGHGSTQGSLWIPSGPNRDSQWMTSDELAVAVDQTTEKIEGMQVRVAIDSCYSGAHFPRFATRMPLDPNAKEPDDVARDVLVITATTALELAVGAALPGDTFTEDIADCINDHNGVDFEAMLDCLRSQASTQTPQQSSWWNNGD